MSDNFGYRDQEVLAGAIATYVSTKVKKSIGIIKGMIRISISEVCGKHGVSLRDMKALSEDKRDAIFMDMLVFYIGKLNLDITLRRKLKYDLLQIYERWKESRRQEIEEVDPKRAKQLQAKNKLPNREDEKEDFEQKELISDLDNLELTDFD